MNLTQLWRLSEKYGKCSDVTDRVSYLSKQIILKQFGNPSTLWCYLSSVYLINIDLWNFKRVSL